MLALSPLLSLVLSLSLREEFIIHFGRRGEINIQIYVLITLHVRCPNVLPQGWRAGGGSICAYRIIREDATGLPHIIVIIIRTTTCVLQAL